MQNEAENLKPAAQGDGISFLKAAPLLGLPAAHVAFEAVSQKLAGQALYSLVDPLMALANFGPTIFMFCMGCGVAGSRTTPKRLARQGIQLILIQILLNIVRLVIPSLVLMAAGIRLRENIAEYFLLSDIYYFAGLFFLFLALMRRFRVSTLNMLLICLGLITVNRLAEPFLAERFSGSLFGVFLGSFIYVDEDSLFPAACWMIYPVVGMLIGEILKHREADWRKQFMRRMLVCSAVFSAALAVSARGRGQNPAELLLPVSSSGATDLSSVMMVICAVLILASLADLLCGHIAGSRFYSLVIRFSASIMPYFLLQWVFVEWEMTILLLCGMPEGGFGLGWYLASTAVITLGSAVLAIRYGKRIMKPVLKITAPWNWRFLRPKGRR